MPSIVGLPCGCPQPEIELPYGSAAVGVDAEHFAVRTDVQCIVRDYPVAYHHIAVAVAPYGFSAGGIERAQIVGYGGDYDFAVVQYRRRVNRVAETPFPEGAFRLEIVCFYLAFGVAVVDCVASDDDIGVYRTLVFDDKFGFHAAEIDRRRFRVALYGCQFVAVSLPNGVLRYCRFAEPFFADVYRIVGEPDNGVAEILLALFAERERASEDTGNGVEIHQTRFVVVSAQRCDCVVLADYGYYLFAVGEVVVERIVADAYDFATVRLRHLSVDPCERLGTDTSVRHLHVWSCRIGDEQIVARLRRRASVVSPQSAEFRVGTLAPCGFVIAGSRDAAVAYASEFAAYVL